MLVLTLKYLPTHPINRVALFIVFLKSVLSVNNLSQFDSVCPENEYILNFQYISPRAPGKLPVQQRKCMDAYRGWAPIRHHMLDWLSQPSFLMRGDSKKETYTLVNLIAKG